MRLIALLAGVLILSAACRTAPATPTDEAAPAFTGEELVPPLPAPDFDLTDQKGERLRLADLRGRLVLLGFVYTGCPDVCIRLTASLRAVQQEFAAELERDLVIVLISIDPEGDTAERTRNWTDALGGRWHYLRGERPALERAWSDYDIVVQKTDSGLVNHSVRTYLIDRDGQMRVRYGGLGWERAAIRDIRRLRG